jgi:AcrR family transcriptional regulator
MSPRRYRMTQRAASAEDTRRRIVEATFALHVEKGVAATTFRDISERADVGIGTIYQHFPSYEHVIEACGMHAFTVMRPPHEDIFEGTRGIEQRVRLLVRELFALYQRFPVFGRIRDERHQFEAIERAMMSEEQNRRTLIAAAFRGARASERSRALAFSMLDVDVYQSLRHCGIEHDAAVDEITNVLLARVRSKRRAT